MVRNQIHSHSLLVTDEGVGMVKVLAKIDDIDDNDDATKVLHDVDGYAMNETFIEWKTQHGNSSLNDSTLSTIVQTCFSLLPSPSHQSVTKSLKKWKNIVTKDVVEDGKMKNEEFFKNCLFWENYKFLILTKDKFFGEFFKFSYWIIQVCLQTGAITPLIVLQIKFRLNLFWDKIWIFVVTEWLTVMLSNVNCKVLCYSIYYILFAFSILITIFIRVKQYYRCFFFYV